jgi:hypothetical protein
MIRLIKFLFTGSWHEHKWKILTERIVNTADGQRLIMYECQCETCGTIKGFNPSNDI